MFYFVYNLLIIEVNYKRSRSSAIINYQIELSNR